MRHNIKKIFVPLLLLTSIILATGCTKTQPSPLRIASSPWPGYEPLYLARDLGYFDHDKVILFELPSSDITMESFRNHSTDIATLTLDETLELLHDGTRLRILLIMDVSNGGDAVLAKPEIKRLSDIKGKRISIVNIPLGLYMLNRLLDKAEVSRNDVQVFPMADTQQESFYRQGKADLVITYEPTKTRLTNRGMHVIFDSSDIPNEIFDILVVHEDVYQKRQQELCIVVQQWFRTLEYMKEHPEDAAIRISKRLGVKPEDFPKMMEGIVIPDQTLNRVMLSGDEPQLLGPAMKLNQIMQLEGQITSDVDASIALDTDFARCFSQ